MTRDYVLGIDCETTGFEPGEDHITEIGAVLWCMKTKRPINILSDTIQTKKKLTDEIIGITGITQEMVEPPIARPIVSVLHDVGELAKRASYYMAHNASFDKAFLEWAANYFECPWVDLPWIDTMEDVPYTDEIKSRKLTYMAGEHGFLIPFAHRAIFDVFGMLKIASMYEWQAIQRLQASPTVEIRGLQKFHENDKAKAKKFRWDGDRKFWVKKVKKCNLDADIATYDFPHKILSIT